MSESPCMERFISSFLITFVLLKFLIEVFVIHDWWEIYHIFFCTGRVIAPSHTHSSFLWCLASVCFKFFVHFKINILVEWMVFWSKKDNCKTFILFLHFVDYFTISFLFFTMVSWNNSMIKPCRRLRTFVMFKEISISKIING
jgi:hypothetical protein